MRKTSLRFMAAALLAAVISISGCGANTSETTTAVPATEATTAAPETAATETSSETLSTAETTKANLNNVSDDTIVRVGSLKGPTSMGLVSLMEKAESGNTASNYEFTMVTAADELLGKVAGGDLDIALIPANVANVLYNRTQGGISVLDINTLGVLYVVSSDDSIQSIADLKGRTICLTGKGSTPDYVMNYLLSANGLSSDDVTLEYKSEAAEVAAILKEQPDAVGMLPQPFVTVATTQNEDLKIVLDCTQEWDTLQGDSGSRLITGTTIVRNDFLNKHKELIDQFLKDHLDSTDFANTNGEETAELIAKTGIIEKAPVALKALPYCNIVCITGEDMKSALNGYLEVLFEQDPASVGGALPEDDFYYLP